MAARVVIEGKVHATPGHGFAPASQEYLLTVLVSDGFSDRLYMAQRSFGQGPAASISCESAAQALRPGTAITVHGQGLRDFKFRGQWVRKVVMCDHIEHPAPAPRHEASTAASAA